MDCSENIDDDTNLCYNFLWETIWRLCPEPGTCIICSNRMENSFTCQFGGYKPYLVEHYNTQGFWQIFEPLKRPHFVQALFCAALFCQSIIVLYYPENKIKKYMDCKQYSAKAIEIWVMSCATNIVLSKGIIHIKSNEWYILGAELQQILKEFNIKNQHSI